VLWQPDIRGFLFLLELLLAINLLPFTPSPNRHITLSPI
jgi:hypothetical protein